MLPDRSLRMTGAAALFAALAAAPALADVKAGVDAWASGDFAAAVHEWEGPAAAGDPDAMFDLAQAYRLGRGVPADLRRAQALYAAAAAAGHLLAADIYGLLLFQDGREADALPYLRDAARRGEPRAQYILGFAYFNGELVEKDWTLAYALVTLASGEGRLPQAAAALAEMDGHVPRAQRAQAVVLAGRMRDEAAAARASEPASLDLVAQAPVARAPEPAPTPDPAPASAAPTSAISGAWRVQLGTFSIAENAERMWRELSDRSELSGTERLLVRAGRFTKLQAGGFVTRSAAGAACRALRQSGQDCLVTDR